GGWRWEWRVRAVPGGGDTPHPAPAGGVPGRKISIFVCARAPLSSGFSILEPGVVTCPPTGEVCAFTPEAASNATINTENDKQRQRRGSRPSSECRFGL